MRVDTDEHTHASRAERAVDQKNVLVFGEYEYIQVPVDKLVRMPQVRSDVNPDLKDIKESIRTKGLLNPIDVALVSQEQLVEYIAFTNQLWGKKTDMADFEGMETDDLYALVIAGHTRTEAIAQLQHDDPEQTYVINAKLHNISDPSDIIALQLDENLHSKPAQERRAMAIVEAYMYGKVHGKWSNEREFLDQNQGKFSKKILHEAIGFARLPAEVRDFVLTGYLSYNAAVEIGRATSPLIDNILANFGISPDESLDNTDIHDLEDTVRKKLDIWISHIQAGGMNSTAAKTYIKGQVAQLEAQTAKLRDVEEEETIFTMADNVEQRVEYRKQLARELADAHRHLAAIADRSGATVMQLHVELSGMEDAEAVRTLERSLERLRREMGDGALSEAMRT